MEFLTQLWLPIIVSAVAVFVASSIIWMATPLHKHDFKNPGAAEGPIMDLVRQLSLSPGVYFVPWCHGKDMKDPAVQQKMNQGPWAQLVVIAGPPNMGKMLGLWMLHLLIVSVFVAYMVSLSQAMYPVASAGEAAGVRPGFTPMFRVAGTTALIAHAGYAMPMSIWHGLPWKQVPGRVLDGIIYACVTGAIFGALAG